MPAQFRLTLGQLNPTVGDFAGNAALARSAFAAAKKAGADMLALPEMFITGYQVQDLVLRPSFTADAYRHIEQLALDCADGPTVGIGGPLFEGGKLYNAYFILKNGKIETAVKKHHLPNDHVFDEKRVYDAAPINGPYRVGPMRIGTPICEDAWHEDVCEALAETGADILLVPNGSPYFRHKHDRRINLMVSRVVESGLPLIYLNMTGGQDDQVFDGASFVLNPGGALAAQLPAFDDAIVHVDFEETVGGWRARDGEREKLPDVLEQDYRAIVEALRDYMAKSGFSSVVLGLSGGVDSALVAVIAADALGAENVRCVMLPSEYTSDASLEDAGKIVQQLGCRFDTLSITETRSAVTNTLAPVFDGTKPDTTEENIQSRLRGLLLMALSNKFGEILLTTGNKSEVAVGYATIYGDMSGGYNPLKDVYKTEAFAMCRWRNANHRSWMSGSKGSVIPQSIIDKPPSAELRLDQTDQDSLPPYEVLDAILQMLIDDRKSVADVVAAGFDRAEVKRVENLIFTSEYKRFQSAPGARLSGRAFWLDRRYPIVNRWRDPT